MSKQPRKKKERPQGLFLNNHLPSFPVELEGDGLQKAKFLECWKKTVRLAVKLLLGYRVNNEMYDEETVHFLENIKDSPYWHVGLSVLSLSVEPVRLSSAIKIGEDFQAVKISMRNGEKIVSDKVTPRSPSASSVFGDKEEGSVEFSLHGCLDTQKLFYDAESNVTGQLYIGGKNLSSEVDKINDGRATAHVSSTILYSTFFGYFKDVVHNLGQDSVSLTLIPPTYRPLITCSSRFDLEASVFDFLFWYRKFCQPKMLYDFCVELYRLYQSFVPKLSSVLSKLAHVRMRGIVRLLLVWFIRSANFDFNLNESLFMLLQEFLTNQTIDTDVRSHFLTVEKLVFAPKFHNTNLTLLYGDVAKKALGGLSQTLTLKFLSLTKFSQQDCFCVLQELGVELISRVLLLRACNIMSKLCPKHFCGLHWLYFLNDDYDENLITSVDNPLIQIVFYHRCLSRWASSVVFYQPNKQADNFSNLVMLCKTLLSSGDALSAAAIYQGLSRPAVLKLKLDLQPKIDSTLKKVQQSLEEITLLSDQYINYPLKILFESLLNVETCRPLFLDPHTIAATSSGKSVLSVGAFRKIAQVWDIFLVSSNKSKCVLQANGGPNVASDKNLVLAEWVETLYLYVMTEEQINFSALNRLQVDVSGFMSSPSPRTTPRSTPKSSPRVASSPRNPFKNRKGSHLSVNDLFGGGGDERRRQSDKEMRTSIEKQAE